MLRIREIRKARGMTLAALAKIVNITPAALCRYEKGNRKPSIVMAFKIANALGVTVDELFGRKAG